MSDLPPGWIRTTLGELGHYWNGRGFKKHEWRETGRPIIRIQNLTGSGSTFNYFQGEVDERHVARRGDLLVSWAATLGVFEWKGPEAVVNQHIFKVDSFIDRRFHRYLLEYVLDDLQAKTHGSGMVHITRKRFDETPVQVPESLDEQQRIVETIEEQFSRLDAGVESLQRAKRNLARFRASVLAAAANSKLDISAGDSRVEAESWRATTLGELLVRIEAGKSFKALARPAAEDEWGVIKVSAMTWGDFREGENKALPAGMRFDPAFEIAEGDLLLSRANTSEYVGASVLVQATRPRLLLSDKSMRLHVREGVNKRWLWYTLLAPPLRSQMSAVATGTSDSMRNISQEKVRNLSIKVPPLDIQNAVVMEVDKRLSVIDALEVAVQSALTRSETLRGSVLRAAFSGDLQEART